MPVRTRTHSAQLQSQIDARDAFLAEVSRGLGRVAAQLPDPKHPATRALNGFLRELSVIAQSEQPRPARRTFDAAKRVQAIVLGAWPALEQKLGPRPAPKFEFAPRTRVQCDPEHFETLILELVSNALKYGGAEPIAVQVRQRADLVWLSVLDRGEGFRGRARNVGGRFVRGVAPAHSPGFGVGLWLARRLAEANGGRVRIRSRLAGGSEVRIELPTARAGRGHSHGPKT